MKRFLVAIVFFTVASGVAFGDLVVEQKIESQALNGAITMKQKNGKARIDMQSDLGEITTILNPTSEEVTLLVHSNKTAYKVDLPQWRKYVTSRQKASSVDPSSLKAPKPTGIIERVGKWDSEIYTYEFGPQSGRLWVAKDYPNGKALNDRINSMFILLAPDVEVNTASVPGMVVKTERKQLEGKAVISLLNISEQDVDDSEFMSPTDYKVVSDFAP